MTTRLSLALIAAVLVSMATPAFSQTASVVATCGASTFTSGSHPLQMTPDGKLCTDASFSGSIGSVSTAATATSSLPTLVAGTRALQESLGGGLYVQPVFGSSAGGGTQVDATHGLPMVGIGTAGTAAGGVLSIQGVASMTKLLVTPDSVALPANQSVNTSQVNGVTTLTGSGAVGTGAQRVAVGTDTATIAGSAPGTAGTASTNVLTVQGIASMTKLLVTPDLPTGASTAANQTNVQGTVGAGTAPASMTVIGGQYNATAPTPTDTQTVALQTDITGKLRTTAQPSTQNMVSGTANTTGSSTTSLVGLVSAKRLYIVSFSCANTGSTASLISFQDGSGGTTLWTTIVPAGGGSNVSGSVPLFWTTAGTALYFLPGSASTTIYCSAAGFSGA